MIVISDSTPLIHFGTIERLDLLQAMYGQVFITGAIYREVVTEGVALGKTDAFLIEKEIGSWIKIVNPKDDPGEICSRYRIHIGEAEAILLARELDADLILINERDGRRAAKKTGIEVKGTIGVISDCIRKRFLTVEAAVEIMAFFGANPYEFWIDPKIIDVAIESLLRSA